MGGFFKAWAENPTGIVVTLFFGVFLFLGPGNIAGHTLTHEYPIGYFATDSFQHLNSAEAAITQGHYKWLPEYMGGGHDKTLIENGPGEAHLVALFHYLAKTPSYDSQLLFYGFIFVLIPLLFFLLIQRANKFLAWLSLPLFFFMLKTDFYITYLWGQFGSILGVFFLVAFFVVFMEEHLKKAISIGLFFSAIVLSHVPEALYAVLFGGSIVAYSFFIRRTEKAFLIEELKKYALAASLSIAACAYYLHVFFAGRGSSISSGSGFGLEIITPAEFGLIRVPTFGDFPLIIGGLIVLGVMLYIMSKKETKKELFPFFLLMILTNMNYFSIGIDLPYRAFQLRFFWPIILAPFFGLVLYNVATFLFRKVNASNTTKSVAVILVAFVLAYLVINSSFQQGTGSVITKNTYDALKKTESIANSKDRILFLYADGVGQYAAVMNRYFQMISEQSMMLGAKENISEKIKVEKRRSATSNYYENGEIKTQEPKEGEASEESICNYDYYILGRGTAYGSPLISYNQKFFERVKDTFEVVYENQEMIILRNQARGEGCV